MASEEAHRGALGADVIVSAAHMVVGAGIVEEARDRCAQRPAADLSVTHENKCNGALADRRNPKVARRSMRQE